MKKEIIAKSAEGIDLRLYTPILDYLWGSEGGKLRIVSALRASVNNVTPLVKKGDSQYILHNLRSIQHKGLIPNRVFPAGDNTCL